MNERQKRLNEVYEHLRKFYGIHTQSDFANALRKSRNAITLALNGDEKYLTNKLFKNICEAYKGVFNLEYLLNGTGDLLTPQEDVVSSEIEQTSNLQSTNSTADMLELYAQRVRLVDDLRQSLKEELAEVRAIKEDMHQAVYDFRDATYRLTQALAKLNENNNNISQIGMAADEG